jgi:hypothetical protein
MIRTPMKVVTLAFVIGMLASLTAGSKADEAADPRAKLDTAIPEAIRLLEAKEYKTMLKEFGAPDALKKILGEVSLDQFAERFAAGKADDLLKALKSIKGKKPEMSDDGNKATFTLADRNAQPVILEKIDKCWYIAN